MRDIRNEDLLLAIVHAAPIVLICLMTIYAGYHLTPPDPEPSPPAGASVLP